MRRAPLTLLLALLSAGCGRLPLVVEGLRCDADNSCGDGFLCVQGHCSSARACSSSETLRVYSGASSGCGENGCRAIFSELTCDSGCEEGICRNDRCAGVSCVESKPSVCLDANTLQTFALTGTCEPADGSCRYAPTQVTCARGCSEGRCNDDTLCEKKLCKVPPEPQCVPGGVRTYAGSGSCEEGTGRCLFRYRDEPCAGSCANGVCAAAAFTQPWPALKGQVTAVDQAPGTSGNHVVVVGQEGFAARYNGTSWQTLNTGTTQDLRAVWLASPTLGYAVGAGATLLRYDGNAFTPVNPGVSLDASAELVAVHGLTDRHVLVASRQGDVLRFNGAAWSLAALPATNTYQLTSAFVGPAGDDRVAGLCLPSAAPCVLYAGGINAPFVADLALAPASGSPFRALGPSLEGSRYALAGLSDGTRRHDSQAGLDTTAPTGLLGAEVVGLSEGTATSIFALTAPSSAEKGRLYRVGGAPAFTATELFRVDGSAPALSRAYSGGVIVADSVGAATHVFRRGVVTDEALELAFDWVAVSTRPDGASVLLSAQGDLAARPKSGGAAPIARASEPAVYSQLSAGAGFALAVGNGGRLLRWDYSAPPTRLPTSASGSLTSLCRVSDSEFYAVGESGVSLKTDGNVVTPLRSGTTQTLHAVTCLGAGSALAVGEGGTVLRLTNGTWSALTPPFPDSSAELVHVSSLSGRLYVATATTLSVLANDDWARVATLPANTTALVVRDSGEVYAASGRDVLRLDESAGKWNQAFRATAELLGAQRDKGRSAFVGRSGVVVDAK